MTGNKSILLWIWLLLICPAVLFAADLTPTALELKLRGVREAGPPELLGSRLLLTYKADRPVRQVAARFSLDDYRTLHVYRRADDGIFLLLYDLPEGVGELRYRITVDGLWMADPANPDREQDDFGTEFSRVTLKEPPARLLDNPEVGADGLVTLWLRAAPGKQRVSVSGTFNNWDPFHHPLSEVRPGLYRVRLRLLPGQYWYVFWVDGARKLDAINLQTGLDEDGATVSTFTVPAPRLSARTDLDYLDLRLLRARPEADGPDLPLLTARPAD